MKKVLLALLVLACPLFSFASTYESGRLSGHYYHIACSDNVTTICWGAWAPHVFYTSCSWKCNKVKGHGHHGSFTVPAGDCIGEPFPSFANLEVAKRDLGDKVCSKL